MNEVQYTPREYLAVSTKETDTVIERLAVVQDTMKRAMVQGLDYGQIPGTSSKPTLLKPGAEKLCMLFRLCPYFDTIKTWDGDHLIVETVCTIKNLAGDSLGQSNAICSTKEAKYAYRTGERVCPECGKAAIIKGKAEYGGGWLCFKKKDGCGAKFADDDQAIVSQQTGRVPNENVADCYNTVIRMAEKRAHVAATRLVLALSSLFDEQAPEFEAPEVELPPPKPKESNGAPAKTPKEQRQENRPDVVVLAEFSKRLTIERLPDLDALNKAHAYVVSVKNEGTRKGMDVLLKEFAKKNNCHFDEKWQRYVADPVAAASNDGPYTDGL